jgi:hypothetical protein
MRAPSDGNGRPSPPDSDAGVLANLPRARPQRSTARRAAARRQTARNGAAGAQAQAKPAKPAKAKASAARQPKRRSSPPRPAPPKVDERVPRQGFESELDRARGAVEPPGSAELVASAAELIGELARGGLSRGERLLRDALSWLPRS